MVSLVGPLFYFNLKIEGNMFSIVTGFILLIDLYIVLPKYRTLDANGNKFYASL